MSSEEKLDATRLTSPLASVQLLTKPRNIPGKDRIVAAKVQGWDVVVSKEFFKEGQIPVCIFFEPDALLDPENEEFKTYDSKKGRRITSKKLYGVFSQGLCLPVDIVKSYGINLKDLHVGQDVTSVLKVTKYVAPTEIVQYNKAAGFPAFPANIVPKSDECNVQSAPELFEAIQGRSISVTLKLDGASMTVTSNGQICGRNFIWDREEKVNEHYFQAEKKFQILEKINGTGFHVQGELVGPKIQGNPLSLKEVDWFVFNIFYQGSYLPHAQVIKLCAEWGFNVVPSVENFDPKASLEDWMDMVDQLKYPISQKPAEGIVVKTEDHGGNLIVVPRISFKIISRNYKPKE